MEAAVCEPRESLGDAGARVAVIRTGFSAARWDLGPWGGPRNALRNGLTHARASTALARIADGVAVNSRPTRSAASSGGVAGSGPKTGKCIRAFHHSCHPASRPSCTLHALQWFPSHVRVVYSRNVTVRVRSLSGLTGTNSIEALGADTRRAPGLHGPFVGSIARSHVSG